MAGRIQLPAQSLFPASTVVHLFPDDADIVAGQLDFAAFKRTNLVASEMTDEVSELEQHVLPRPRFQFSLPYATALVISREQHHGKPNIAVRLDLLDNSATAVCLLMQDDWFEANLFEEASHGLTGALIVTVNHEHTARKNLR